MKTIPTTHPSHMYTQSIYNNSILRDPTTMEVCLRTQGLP
ncbi:hypothetical protein NXF25_019133 [Crotalus adamanteus]|uniref:Uncharacterized protein n=1 Tax=Crotalus adamanteus TaxID=8729 RepID=A0AAW1B2P8_CROAD